MAKLIALELGFPTAWALGEKDFSSRLKRKILLFDQIGIKDLDQSVDSFRQIFSDQEESKEIEHNISELEWLKESELIFEPTDYSIPELLSKNFNKHLALKYRKADSKVQKLTKKSKKTRDIDTLASLADGLIEGVIERDSIILRLISAKMELSSNISVATTLPFRQYTYDVPDSQKSIVAQIVINKLPLPEINTPWEQILDYRNDPENQNNLLSLRRWIRKISSESLSGAEIEEEIEWLTNEFQEHMKYHKIKASTETLEVLVKGPLEIIEDLVRLKLSKIPEPFFAIKKRQLMLMNAEINAPGKELAYIIKSTDELSTQK